MIYNIEEGLKKDALLQIVSKMAVAARTAPKSRGIDNICISVVTDNTIKVLSDEMIRISKNSGPAFFARDAKNILSAGAILLLGVKFKTIGLNCSYCGYENCAEKEKYPEVPCAFNTTDLGIAVGSAVSIAADNRVDNRVMYSVGVAVKNLKMMADDVKIIFAIPISATGKNVFFDRK